MFCRIISGSLNFHTIALQWHVQKNWVSLPERDGDVVLEAFVQNTWHLSVPMREPVLVFPACWNNSHSAEPRSGCSRELWTKPSNVCLCSVPDFKRRRESQCQFITNCPSWHCLFNFLELPTLQITVNTNLLILEVSGFLWCYQTCWLLSWLNAQSRHSYH